MRFPVRKAWNSSGGDMTPMIDLTFQLIAFFMIAMNFSQAEQDERVMLPASALAKPPDRPLENPVVVHLARDGTVIYGGQELANMNRLRPYLVNERMVMQGRNQSMSDSTVIIRADRFARAGVVQKLIQLCQEEQFEKFSLRAQEEVGP
ncbi:MAG: ExbD/TolR family protein [Pirellulaceae bacterium]